MYSLVYLLCTIKIEIVLLSHNINLRNKGANNNVSCLKKIKEKKKILTKKDKKVILENMYTEFNKVKKVHLKKDRISSKPCLFHNVSQKDSVSLQKKFRYNSWKSSKNKTKERNINLPISLNLKKTKEDNLTYQSSQNYNYPAELLTKSKNISSTITSPEQGILLHFDTFFGCLEEVFYSYNQTKYPVPNLQKFYECLYFQLKKKHNDLQEGAFHWFLVESKNIFNYKKELISKIKQSISQSQFKKYSSLIFQYFEICEKNKNKLIKSIISTQNNFSIIVNFLVDNFDRSKYIYDKKDILEMLQSELSLLIGLFLPEFRYLNKIIIQQLNIPLEIPKIHFIVSMFILQAFFSWYTISHTMYFTPISLKTNIFLHKTSYFIEESVKLRTILILLCKEVQLEHCKTLLENITSRYLMYFSFSHKENQSKLFWYYLGNLIVFKNYGEPKECKKFLEDNFYECLSLNNLLLNLETHNDFEMREKLKILMKQKTIATNDISDFSFSNPLNVLNDREENYSIEEFVKIILSERIAIVYRKTENIFK